MNPGGRSERELKALDALIVSQLRRHGCVDEVPELEELPELTADEQAALEALGADFMEGLFSCEVPPAYDPPAETETASREVAMTGGGLPFGLNRADQIDPETAEELERRRKEIIERIRRRDRGGDAGG